MTASGVVGGEQGGAGWPLLSEVEVQEALLRHNYFPNSASGADDLPPCFTTADLADGIAKAIAQLPLRAGRQGYDVMSFSATRVDLVPRKLEIPHPHPYLKLSDLVVENWSDISSKVDNSLSRLRPRRVGDGRIASMRAAARRRHLQRFGSRFVVHADIATFYDSIYSHAVPWALLGRTEAKRQRHEKRLFANQLDEALRMCRRNETTGISIGPATSLIAAELLLSAIDERLSSFEYDRFIDDYVVYCKSLEQAEKFIDELGKALAEFKLVLNSRKTRIEEQPQAQAESWRRELGDRSRGGNAADIRGLLDILDAGLDLSAMHPQSSTLKYAAVLVERRFSVLRSEADRLEILQRMLALAWHRPEVIPVAMRIAIAMNTRLPHKVHKMLDRLVRQEADRSRSDSLAWLVFATEVCGIELGPKTIAKVIECGDALSLALLASSPSSLVRRQAAIVFANRLMQGDPEDYDLDRYWLLLYTIHLAGDATYTYVENDAALRLLVQSQVQFIKWPEDSVFDELDDFWSWLNRSDWDVEY